ncbi:TonB family protein [Sphingomonas sp. LHG3406-1]|uniref:TonB family protein n=1 Tax=Sphingomonas sp. LHG3406-1 TaxID=2804617 RepID=UPI002633057C|nr:TonB family protein [Sphingomonas sp. LHG3406-1]
MQRTTLSRKDRAGAIALVLLVHAGVIAALFALSPDVSVPKVMEGPLEMFDVSLPPPPPPPPPPPTVVESKAAPREEGAAAPPARKAEASPVQRPDPVVELPPPPPTVTAAPTPGTGAAPSAGAAPVDGPGSGAGGQGSGTGSGGSGSGPGGGGDGGEGRGPSVIAGTTLTGRSYPREVLRAWPRGSRVFVAVRVQLDGRATDCKVNRSSGNAIVDQWTCRLVEERVRFRPAVDGNGRPVVRWYGYIQAPVNF